MKTILLPACLLAVLLGLLASACAPGEPAKPEPTGPEKAAVTAAPKQLSTWDQLMAQAKREGKVILYAEITPQLRATLGQAVRDRFGIELDVVSGRALEVAQKYLAENQSGVNLADVFMLGQTTTLTVVKPRGVLAPVSPLLLLPEVTDPKAWKEGKVPFLDKDQTAVPMVASYRSFIVFNTEMVSEKEFQSYQDLLQPKWKGKIIFNDPTATGSGGTFVAFMVVKVLGTEEGTKYMRQLALQQPVVTRDARFQVESVAKGKYPVALAPSSGVVAEFQRVQAPLEWASKVKEGGIVIPGAAVISMPQNPAHPAAARVFLNWLLTREGQEAVVKGFGQPAQRVDVSTENVVDRSVIPPEGVKLLFLDEQQILMESKLRETLSKEIFGPLIK